MSVTDVQQDSLDQAGFFKFVLPDKTGYVHIATKAVTDNKWRSEFFEWPSQLPAMLAYINQQKADHEVYYGPALLKNKQAKKEDVDSATVLWAEFDGTIPESSNGSTPTYQQPSLRITSSIPNEREHWYWRLDSTISRQVLEQINRALTYSLHADYSGWDSTQLLRIPGTYNHKRKRQVSVRHYEVHTIYSVGSFQLPEPPPLAKTPVPTSLPEAQDVVALHRWPPALWRLFREGKAEGQRSDGLMSLGYGLAEIQLTDEEMFSVLLNADERWGKFKDRPDRDVRLCEIITKARVKYPLKTNKIGLKLVQSEREENLLGAESVGLVSFMQTSKKVEWIWERYLHEKGYLLLTGASGIGKTQFSLDAAAKFALGRDFLGTTVHRPCKVDFISLEMNDEELKEFVGLQLATYPESDRALLEQNFRIHALGEPFDLLKQENRDALEQRCLDENFDGIFIDSIGSIIDDATSNKEPKLVLNWFDHLRNTAGVFLWLIHHNVKPNVDNKKPNKLSDVYGNQYWYNRASSTLILWEENKDLLLYPRKVRFGKKPETLALQRTADLTFNVIELDKIKNIIEKNLPKVKPPKQNQLVGTQQEKVSLKELNFPTA